MGEISVEIRLLSKKRGGEGKLRDACGFSSNKDMEKNQGIGIRFFYGQKATNPMRCFRGARGGNVLLVY